MCYLCPEKASKQLSEQLVVNEIRRDSRDLFFGFKLFNIKNNTNITVIAFGLLDIIIIAVATTIVDIWKK